MDNWKESLINYLFQQQIKKDLIDNIFFYLTSKYYNFFLGINFNSNFKYNSSIIPIKITLNNLKCLFLQIVYIILILKWQLN